MLDKRSVVDLVGVAAVVASLIFVGVQIQQGASATRSATVLQLKDSWVQLNLALATSPELSNAFDIVEAQGWDANPQANRLVAAFYRALFHTWSNAYYQYLNGTLEEDQWLPHLRDAEVGLSSPIARQVWSDWKHTYDDPFRELMDSLMAERVR